MTIKYPAWGAEPLPGWRWAILLYGFDIGSAKLKHEHVEVLNQFALMLRAESAKCGFVVAAKGNGSRSGSAAVNLALSMERAAAVSKYLSPLVSGFASVMPMGLGEASAALDGLPDGFESERHRSVLLMAVDYKKKGPPPPKAEVVRRLPNSILPRVNRKGHFSVQLRAGWEGSAGVPLPYGIGVGGQVTRFKLRFRDLGRGTYGDFILWAISGKIDWGSPGSLEKLGPGPETFFHVKGELRIWDLAGFVKVDLLSADFGSKSKGFGKVTVERTLDPSGEYAWIQFPIPPGNQVWEFGKFGVGGASGKGYLSVAD
jgi:hypothetical protein